ncbi:hypothetical protein AAFF_G00006240 [Aldrovandia affinis]|uniref:Uncharacterized protein n=1 Tax=Aldrovandia affinis TaxID=143900 RepID=A0AAD7TDZ8_9TELE|nr:hypothetical protein AAFF_G00006240 [Aldrovandia affinis]
MDFPTALFGVLLLLHSVEGQTISPITGYGPDKQKIPDSARERWSTTTRMDSHTDVSYNLKGQFKTSLQSQVKRWSTWVARQSTLCHSPFSEDEQDADDIQDPGNSTDFKMDSNRNKNPGLA